MLLDGQTGRTTTNDKQNENENEYENENDDENEPDPRRSYLVRTMRIPCASQHWLPAPSSGSAYWFRKRSGIQITACMSTIGGRDASHIIILLTLFRTRQQHMTCLQLLTDNPRD